jgi:hypothetical protein
VPSLFVKLQAVSTPGKIIRRMSQVCFPAQLP